MTDSNILPLIKSSRTHKDSECDSLLADTHSASSSSNHRPLNSNTASSIYRHNSSANDVRASRLHKERQQESSATNSDYHSLISEPPDHQSLTVHHDNCADDPLTVVT